MSRIIRVRKSLGKVPLLIKVERNQYIASKVPEFPVLNEPPHTPESIEAVCKNILTLYGLHLQGDKEAFISMNEQLVILDEYYFDTAEYVENMANRENDASLPVAVGFVLHAKISGRPFKSYKVYDGEHPGEIVFEFPVIENAIAYNIDVAEENADGNPIFKHENGCGVTRLLIKGKKSNTRYLFRVAGIFSKGEGPYSEPVSFRTKDWQYDNK